MRQRGWVFPVVVAVAILVSWPFAYAGFAWVPAPLLLATVIAHSAPRPIRWLSLLTIVAELCTALPLGVMTVAIFIPYCFKRLARRLETDLSIWFFLYVLSLTALQVACLSLPAWSVAAFYNGWQNSVQFFPWPMAVITTVATAVLVFTLLIIRSFSLPSPWTR